MNIACGRRVLDYQQVGAQQLRVQRRRERQPEDAALTGSVDLLGIAADAPTAAERRILRSG